MSRLFVFFLVRCRSKLAPILAWPISNELINMGFYSFSNYTHSVGIIVFADFSTPSFQTSPRSLYSRNKAYFLGTPALSSFFLQIRKASGEANHSAEFTVLLCDWLRLEPITTLRPRSKVTCLSTWDLVTVGRLSSPGRVIGWFVVNHTVKAWPDHVSK